MCIKIDGIHELSEETQRALDGKIAIAHPRGDEKIVLYIVAPNVVSTVNVLPHDQMQALTTSLPHLIMT